MKILPIVKSRVNHLSYDPEVDGVTNSLLANWGGCRERARLSLKGYVKRGASFALTYGDLTHWLLQHVYEDHRAGKLPLTNGSLSPVYVKNKIATLDRIWREENPTVSPETQQQAELTMMLNKSAMPLYFEHWKRDFTEIEWVGLESEFKIPFEVTRNGITYKTFLRGKRDGVFRRGKRLRLFETKTKSRIDEGTLVDILPFESQVNFYLIAMWEETGEVPGGVLYNIVRRPALRQKKNESITQFAARLVDDIQSRPLWYYLRQNMVVDAKELDRYRGELEDRVWEFMHWWRGEASHWRESSQCENKYGVCPYLSVCSRGDYAALTMKTKIFTELGDDL